MDTQLATMQLFTRRSSNKPWKRISAAEPAVVGKAGLGWGYSFLDLKEREEPEKVEGDKRTPAGFFRVFAVRAAELAEARPELAAAVEPLLKAREAIERQIADLDRKVMPLARNDAQVRRFMTAPGVGPITP